jgi:glycosyltransferase involved in cell wall biosynthesis
VTGTGPLSDAEMLLLYHSGDAFINCSRYDGMPLALLEAMAAGLPVLATAAGGSEDVIDPGRSGYLIPPDEGFVAGLMAKITGDGALRSALGAAARVTAARYSWDRIAQQYRAVYAAAGGGGAR